MKRIIDRDEIMARFKKENTPWSIAQRISEEIMHKVQNHRYDWSDCGGWYEDLPRKTVEILIQHGYFVQVDPNNPNRFAVLFRERDLGIPLYEEVQEEEFYDEDMEEMLDEVS